MNKHWQTLEFPKILARVAERTSFSAGRDLALALEPTSSLIEARAWQQETTEARGFLEAKGSVSIGGAHDVRPLVERAERGLTLLPTELLDIQSTLEAGWRLKRTLTRLRDQFPRLADHASAIDIRREKGIARQRLMDRLQGMISSPQYAPLYPRADPRSVGQWGHPLHRTPGGGGAEQYLATVAAR